MEKSTVLKKITARKLETLLAGNPDVLLLDTRPSDIHARCQIPGAKNACVYEVVFPDRVRELAPDLNREVIVYGSSRHSRDSRTAAEKLLRLGYSNVHALEGGIAAWQQAGLAVAGGQPHAAEDPATRLVLEDRIYRVDIERSLIEWTGRNASNRHVGSVRLSEGELRVSAGAVGGHFEIDMRSIRNYNLEGDELQPVLIAHLESDDFFFVKLFPKATFTITSVKTAATPYLSAPNAVIKGSLALRGAKRPILFPATVTRQAGGGIAAEAHFDIDRTRWNAIYGSARFFEHLGMHMVFDLVSIEVRILAH
jgi:rhodanese-related sulfurtransferase/polyisoprenoid-binding protein YceI